MIDTIRTIMYWLTWVLPRPEVVLPNERAVKLRCGKVVGEYGPGWVWMWPPTDDVLSLYVTEQVIDIRSQSVTTSDDKCIAISGGVCYKILNVSKALFAVNNFDESLVALCLGIIAHYVNQRSYEDCRNLTDIVEEIRRDIRDEATSKWGVKIVNVWITDFALHKVIRVLGECETVFPDEED